MNYFHLIVGVIFIAFCVEKGKVTWNFDKSDYVLIDSSVYKQQRIIYTKATAHF